MRKCTIVHDMYRTLLTKTDEKTATESVLKEVKWNGAALDVNRGLRL